MSTDKDTVYWYNQNAQMYAAHLKTSEGAFHFGLEKPAMYAQIPDIKGKRVLSLGCGSGEDTAHLNSLGASSSVGIDISEKLIEIAKYQHTGCQFLVMDMEELDFEDEEFDFVYSSLAVHYLESWHKLLREVKRVLKPGGEFLFSTGHPLAAGMEKVTNAGKKQKIFGVKSDEQTNKVTTYGNYFDTKRLTGPDGFKVVFYQRPISDMLKDVIESGFYLKAFLEPKPTEDMLKVDQRHYYEYSHVPWVIIIKLAKL